MSERIEGRCGNIDDSSDVAEGTLSEVPETAAKRANEKEGTRGWEGERARGIASEVRRDYEKRRRG